MSMGDQQPGSCSLFPSLKPHGDVQLAVHIVVSSCDPRTADT